MPSQEKNTRLKWNNLNNLLWTSVSQHFSCAHSGCAVYQGHTEERCWPQADTFSSVSFKNFAQIYRKTNTDWNIMTNHIYGILAVFFVMHGQKCKANILKKKYIYILTVNMYILKWLLCLYHGGFRAIAAGVGLSGW